MMSFEHQAEYFSQQFSTDSLQSALDEVKRDRGTYLSAVDQGAISVLEEALRLRRVYERVGSLLAGGY
jgi:thiamine biosynthesis lipoprotein ApbE